MSSAPAALEKVNEAPPARDQAWRPVVLVIDDDWEICEALQDVLADAGYVGVCLTDAARGLDLLNRVEPRPDAILLDLMMPGMDGWRLVEEIRTAPGLKDIPIVVLTAGTAILRSPRHPAGATGQIEEVETPDASTVTHSPMEYTRWNTAERPRAGCWPCSPWGCLTILAGN